MLSPVSCSPFHVVLQAQGSSSEQSMLQQQLDPLMRVAKAHSKGPEEYARSIVQEVLSQFADVEEMFQTSSGVTTEQVGCTGLVSRSWSPQRPDNMFASASAFHK